MISLEFFHQDKKKKKEKRLLIIFTSVWPQNAMIAKGGLIDLSCIWNKGCSLPLNSHILLAFWKFRISPPVRGYFMGFFSWLWKSPSARGDKSLPLLSNLASFGKYLNVRWLHCFSLKWKCIFFQSLLNTFCLEEKNLVQKGPVDCGWRISLQNESSNSKQESEAHQWWLPWENGFLGFPKILNLI